MGKNGRENIKGGGKSQDEEGKGGSMIRRREGSMEGRKEYI